MDSKFQEQLKLFSIPERKSQSRKWPFVYHLIVIEPDDEYHIWQGGFSLAQAKKIAARKYNRAKGYYESTFVPFSADYQVYKK
ncbi:MAG: hypothetical protein PHH35_01595 [Candidatus Pacebacteria bacterium]|jgi:predicted small integral membrane protein|nr:hypothetical protein [Candidatus Paceibacterota bacterium]